MAREPVSGKVLHNNWGGGGGTRLLTRAAKQRRMRGMRASEGSSKATHMQGLAGCNGGLVATLIKRTLIKEKACAKGMPKCGGGGGRTRLLARAAKQRRWKGRWVCIGSSAAPHKHGHAGSKGGHYATVVDCIVRCCKRPFHNVVDEKVCRPSAVFKFMDEFYARG